MSWSRRHLLLALVPCVACHDSTGAKSGGGRSITVGQATPVNLGAADSSISFTLHVPTDSVYAVEVAPGTGTAYVSVSDSINQLLNAFVVVGSSTAAGERWTQTFAGPASNPWVIRVQSAAPGQVVAVTITVHLVATHPEHIGSPIAFDSTIGGESLDAYDDVDRFTWTGLYRIDVTSSRNGCRDGFGANEPYLGANRIRVDTLP